MTKNKKKAVKRMCKCKTCVFLRKQGDNPLDEQARLKEVINKYRKKILKVFVYDTEEQDDSDVMAVNNHVRDLSKEIQKEAFKMGWIWGRKFKGTKYE